MDRTVRPRILLADDNRLIRTVGREALEALDLDVVEAADGAAAVACFQQTAADLVLLDVNMPEMDGFAACREIRRTREGADTPIVIMTACDRLDSVHQAYEAGATDFATKPLNWTVLAERVRYMLRMGRVVGELRQSREALAEAQQHARIGSFDLDDRDAVEASEEFGRLYGLEAGVCDLEVVLARVHVDDRQAVRDAFTRCRETGEPLELDHRVCGDDGERCIHLRARRADRLDASAHLRGTAQDFTERMRSEEEVRFLAFHDSLTRLGNRQLFTDRLSHSLAQLRRTDRMGAVLFLDLDHFKRINDTLGHDAGDQFLVMVADRLRQCVRDSDCLSRDVQGRMGSTVSRFGGDEFLIALCGIDSADEATLVARRILEQLQEPLEIENESIVIGASIGIAVAPKDGRDVDTLIRNADVAMYHAKQHGKGHAQFYETAMAEGMATDFQLETDLRTGIEQAQLFVQYQPTVELATRRVKGFEALVRWKHPDRGVVPPNDFIPLAESSGLIDAVGEFVLREACRQLRSWQDAGLPSVRVAVNVSPKQLSAPSFVARFQAIIEAAGVEGRQLELELTETAMVENPAQTVQALEAFRGIGLRVSLDDFGTGYSSLSHLKGFPIDTVKIDRSFVKDLPQDRDDVAVTHAILSMASALGLRVVAEGVETEEQLDFLTEHGCAEAQGYFLRPPMSADAATDLLRAEPFLPATENKPRV